MDKYTVSPIGTVLHLMSLYYIYNENDVILNVTDRDLIEDVEATGDSWQNIRYDKDQIVNIRELIYGDKTDGNSNPQVSYFDWLESTFELSLNDIIRKDKVDGEGAHGYYPIDLCPILDIMDHFDVDYKDAAVIDIGAGKGPGIIAFYEAGFRRLGGIEYTTGIYDGMVKNLGLFGLPYREGNNISSDSPVHIWNGDARSLKDELDSYDWFYFFNPFDRKIFKDVLINIEESLKRKPRKAYILYGEPMGDDIVLESGLFKLSYRHTDNYYNSILWYYVYETKQ